MPAPKGALPFGAGVDPYLTWGVVSRFRSNCQADVPIDDVFVDALLQCIEELPQEWQLEAAKPFAEQHRKLAGTLICREPGGTSIYSIRGTLGLLKALIVKLDPAFLRIELSSARSTPTPEKYVQATGMKPPARTAAHQVTPESPAKPVLVVIDDGFGFLNHRFRHRDGATRIHAFWDQDPNETEPAGVDGNSRDEYWQPVYGFGYGRELTGDKINQLLGQYPQPGDERSAYHAIRYKRASRTLTHGNQVAGWTVHSMAEDSKVILVQLPREVAIDTSGAGTAKHVADALAYALERIDPSSPVVVNLSFGAHAGPHDGSTLLERVMDCIVLEQLKTRNFAIVLPAGNAYNTNCHASVTLPAGASHTLSWKIRQDDPTESFCEFWYRAPPGEGLSVSLKSPSGDVWEAGPDQVSPPSSGGSSSPDSNVAVVHCRQPQDEGGMAVAVCCLGPTHPVYGGWEPVPGGVWKIVLKNNSTKEIQVDGWVQRDEAVIYGPYAGRQSRFLSDRMLRPVEEPDDEQDAVKRSGTGNSIAHGSETITVGACYREGLRVTPYSGMGVDKGKPQGAQPAAPRPWPDLLAPGGRNPWHPWLRGEGTQSGTAALMNGTSVAAPQVAALLLLKFGRGERFLSTKALSANLRDQETAQGVQHKSDFEKKRSGGGPIAVHEHQ